MAPVYELGMGRANKEQRLRLNAFKSRLYIRHREQSYQQRYLSVAQLPLDRGLLVVAINEKPYLIRTQ